MVNLIENGDRKAGVEIDIGHVSHALARTRQSHLDTSDGCGIGREVWPLGKHQFGCVRDCVDMHPLVLRHTKLARFAYAGNDHCACLVHLIARDSHAGIRLCNNPVALGDSRQLFC